MKPSHLTTPRTMNDCVFMLNADPIERPENHGYLPCWTKWFAGVVLVSAVVVLSACGSVPVPCDPQRLNCDNGTRATGGSISRPSVSNNPGGLTGGGQVSKPTGPSKPHGGKPHGGKPGHGHGDKNHGHSGPPGKGGKK